MIMITMMMAILKMILKIINDGTTLRKTRMPRLTKKHLQLQGDTHLSEWFHTLEGLIWKNGINVHISLRKPNLRLVKLPKQVSILSFQKKTIL